MTYEEKLVKLVEISKQEVSAISRNVTVDDLLRLVEGDLSDIGDGILENRVVLVQGKKLGGGGFFKGIAEHYSLAPSTRTVFGVEVEEFEDADFDEDGEVVAFEVGIDLKSGIYDIIHEGYYRKSELLLTIPLLFKRGSEAAAVADAMNRLMNMSSEDAATFNKLLDSRTES